MTSNIPQAETQVARQTSSSGTSPSTQAQDKSATTQAPAYQSPDFFSQSLASILNNPYESGSNAGSWGWPFASPIDVSSGADASVTGMQPLVPTVKLPEVILADFEKYLRLVRDRYPRFIAAREAAAKDEAERQGKQDAARKYATLGRGAGQKMGEGLVEAMREVPAFFFEEDFDLAGCDALKAMEEGGEAAGQAQGSKAMSLTMLLQDQLSNYLDRVEVHLLKEISARSDSFFQALAVLQDLSVLIHSVCGKIVGLRQIVHSLDQQLMESAVRMQQLHRRRSNLLSVQEKVRVLESVAQAQADLGLLVATQDFAGALDVMDDIRRVISSGELNGLHCFKHLEDQVEVTAMECDRMMTLDFLRVARLDPSHPNDAGGEDGGEEYEAESLEQEVEDQLGPLALGLLRTSRLSVVIRAYGDNLVEDIKDAVKGVLSGTLAELVRECGADGNASSSAGGEEAGQQTSLASKLQVLPCASVLRLLAAVAAAVQAHLSRAGLVWRVVSLAVEQYSCHPAASLPPLLPEAHLHLTHPGHHHHLQLPTPAQTSVSGVGGGGGGGGGGGPVSPSEAPVVAGQARDRLCREVLRTAGAALTQAVEAAHGRWAKLLGVRAGIHAKLRLEDFSAVMAATESFVEDSEEICGTKCRSLRSTIHTQAKAFLDNMHQQCMSKMASLLESEPWQSADVDEYFQGMVDWVATVGALAEERAKLKDDSSPASNGTLNTAASATNPPHLSNGRDDGKSRDQGAGGRGSFRDELPALPSRGGSGVGSHASSTREVVQIQEERFHMVNSGLMLLNMLVEYIDLARRIPLLSTEVVHRVAELLKLFNSRTCQLVLGAGAMQVSGLKSITAKHLALANQSLTLILALLPSVKQVLGAMLSEQRHLLLLCELDRIGQDYRLHRDEIHSKLIAIMQERLQFQRRKIPQVLEKWLKEKTVENPEPSEFAVSLVKEIAVLRRVLSPLLLQPELLLIFGQVASNFNSALLAAFQKMEYKGNEVVQKHIYTDGMHIANCLQSLPQKEDAKGPGVLQEWLQSEFTSISG